MKTSDKLYIAICLFACEAYLFCKRSIMLGLLQLSIWMGICLLPERANERIISCLAQGGGNITHLFAAYLSLDGSPSINGLTLFLRHRGVPMKPMTILSTYKGRLYMIYIPLEGAYSQLRIICPEKTEFQFTEVLFGSLSEKDLYQRKK